MRKIQDVINRILAVLPDPKDLTDGLVSDEVTVLRAELRILKRGGQYTPPEATSDDEQWNRLGTILYRNLPPPTAFDWAQKVSDIVTESSSLLFPSKEEAGKTAYNAYKSASGGKSLVSGADLPEWEWLSEPIRFSWTHVAEVLLVL